MVEGKSPIITSNKPNVVPIIPESIFNEIKLAKDDLIDAEARELIARAKDEDIGSKRREVLLERAMMVLAKKSDEVSRARIDNSIPSPTMQRYAAFTVIPVPNTELKPAAFLDVSLEELVGLLTEERKETDQQMLEAAGDTVPAGAGQDILDGFRATEEKRNEICDNHYDIIAAGGELLHVLDTLLRSYGAVDFVHYKDSISNILIEYNAHNPFLWVRLEQIALQSLQSEISKLIAHVIDYLVSPDFRLVVSNLGKSNKLISASGQPPGAPVFQINVTKVKLAAKQSRKNLIEEKKDGKIRSIFQLSLESKSVDLSDGRDPIAIVQDFDSLFNSLILRGNGFIAEIHQLAAGINYNVNTNKFGSVASFADNVTKMAEVRTKLIRLINSRRRVSGNARPARILIMSCFDWRGFNLGIGPCELVSTQTFFPNEERKIRLKTSQVDKTTRSQTQNVLTSNSQEVQDSLEKTVEKEINDNASSSEDRNAYIDQNQQLTATYTKANNIGGGINIPYIGLNFSAGTNDNMSNTVTIGTKAGSSVDTNNTCEKSIRNFESAVTGQVRTTASKQEISVQDSVEVTSESTREETTEITIKNPNEASPITVAFYTIVQEFLTTHTLADMRLIFWNGQVRTEYLLQEVNQLLDTYVLESSPVRKLLLEEIQRSGIRFDYLNRRFEVIDNADGTPHFKNSLYLNHLTKIQEAGNASDDDDSEDESLEPFKQHLRGIVMKVSRHTIPRPGLLSRAFVDMPALDSNQTALWGETLRTRKAEADAKELDAKRMAVLIETIQNIPDPLQRAEYAARLLLPPAQLLNNAFLGHVLNSSKDGVLDLTKMIKLTK